MTTFARKTTPTSKRHFGGDASSPSQIHHDWRCICCGKVLGVCRDGRMHLRFARGHEYLVGFPVQANCRFCGTLNEKRDR
jgi:hypothetical protein